MSDQESNHRTKFAFNPRRFDCLQHLNKQIHERRVDEPVAHIRVDNNALKVRQCIQFLVHCPRVISHSSIYVAQVSLDLLWVYLLDNVLGVPRLESQALWVKREILHFFDFLVSDNRLYLGVRIVDYKLLDSLVRHFTGWLLLLLKCRWIWRCAELRLAGHCILTREIFVAWNSSFVELGVLLEKLVFHEQADILLRTFKKKRKSLFIRLGLILGLIPHEWVSRSLRPLEPALWFLAETALRDFLSAILHWFWSSRKIWLIRPEAIFECWFAWDHDRRCLFIFLDVFLHRLWVEDRHRRLGLIYGLLLHLLVFDLRRLYSLGAISQRSITSLRVHPRRTSIFLLLVCKIKHHVAWLQFYVVGFDVSLHRLLRRIHIFYLARADRSLQLLGLRRFWVIIGRFTVFDLIWNILFLLFG